MVCLNGFGGPRWPPIATNEKGGEGDDKKQIEKKKREKDEEEKEHKIKTKYQGMKPKPQRQIKRGIQASSLVSHNKYTL